MSLKKLPKDITVFVDANIFVYALRETDDLKQECTAFFEQVLHGRFKAVTSVNVATEVIHRFMMQEAAEKLEFYGGKLVQHLKENPEFVKSLTRHRQIASAIYKLGVSIEPITYVEVHGSRVIRTNYGLMANDSLIIAFMQKHKISHLATNDGDFKRIPDIKVWLPR